MNFSYKLNKNLLARNAAQLVFALSEVNSTVTLRRKDSNSVNGKSLVGVLSGHFLYDEIVTVFIDTVEELSRVKEIFNEYGVEV